LILGFLFFGQHLFCVDGEITDDKNKLEKQWEQFTSQFHVLANSECFWKVPIEKVEEVLVFSGAIL